MFFLQLFGAALTGLGIWIKVDEEFWDIQTGLDMKQFTMAGYILIAAGVIIMIIGFVGCYGAFAQSLCTLIIVSISYSYQHICVHFYCNLPKDF